MMPQAWLVLLLTTGTTRAEGTVADSYPRASPPGSLMIDFGACVDDGGDGGDAELPAARAAIGADDGEKNSAALALRRVIVADFERFIAAHPRWAESSPSEARFVVRCEREDDAFVLAVVLVPEAMEPRAFIRRISKDEIPSGVRVAFLGRVAVEMMRGAMHAANDRDEGLRSVRTPIRRPVPKAPDVDSARVRLAPLGSLSSAESSYLGVEGGVLAFTRAAFVYKTASLVYRHPLTAAAGVLVRVGGFAGRPKVDSERARVLGLNLDLAARLQHHFPDDAFSVGASVGVRGGWAYLSGISSASAEGVRSSAPTLGPVGDVAVDWEVARPLTVGLRLVGGYTYLGAVGRINGARRVQVIGPWVSVSLSAGLLVW
ncbi:MAG: hypothetical protein IPK13_24215 [Deltaproteobacteria bacterium]|nr:hypothetical protein [Deltaproteobacteria bacterium]